MHSKSLLISLIIGFLYTLYRCIVCFQALLCLSKSLDVIEMQYMSMWIRPHLILVVLAVIFNALGYLHNHKELALISAILYSVAAVANVSYAWMILLPIVFSFLGYYDIYQKRSYG